MHTQLPGKTEVSVGKVTIQRHPPGGELRTLGAFSFSAEMASSRGQSSANLSLLAKPVTNKQVKVQPVSEPEKWTTQWTQTQVLRPSCVPLVISVSHCCLQTCTPPSCISHCRVAEPEAPFSYPRCTTLSLVLTSGPNQPSLLPKSTDYRAQTSRVQVARLGVEGCRVSSPRIVGFRERILGVQTVRDPSKNSAELVGPQCQIVECGVWTGRHAHRLITLCLPSAINIPGHGITDLNRKTAIERHSDRPSNSLRPSVVG